MAYKLKKQKMGRPREMYKVRTISGFTPKGTEFDRIEGKKIIFKRKSKNEK